MIPDNDSVRLLSQFTEEMNLENLYGIYSQIREIGNAAFFVLFYKNLRVPKDLHMPY